MASSSIANVVPTPAAAPRYTRETASLHPISVPQPDAFSGGGSTDESTSSSWSTKANTTRRSSSSAPMPAFGVRATWAPLRGSTKATTAPPSGSTNEVASSLCTRWRAMLGSFDAPIGSMRQSTNDMPAHAACTASVHTTATGRSWALAVASSDRCSAAGVAVCSRANERTRSAVAMLTAMPIDASSSTATRSDCAVMRSECTGSVWK